MPGTRSAKCISMRVVDDQGNLVGYLPETIASQVLDFTSAVRTIVTPMYDTRANFISANAVIPQGKMTIETDTGCVKIGDGTTNYISLIYFNVPGGVGSAVPIRMTKTQFTTNNPVLPNGVLGIESDTGDSKLGDGTTAYNSLEYFITKIGTVTFETI